MPEKHVECRCRFIATQTRVKYEYTPMKGALCYEVLGASGSHAKKRRSIRLNLRVRPHMHSQQVCTWELADGGTMPTHEECEAKVSGVLEWLFGVWYTEVRTNSPPEAPSSRHVLRVRLSCVLLAR